MKSSFISSNVLFKVLTHPLEEAGVDLIEVTGANPFRNGDIYFYNDTKKLAEQCKKIDGCMSDDSFLYSRCVALINGVDYYKKAKMGRCKEMWKMEFESLLYVPESAWAKKHNKPESEYPHVSSFSYETGSNTDGWK